MFGSLGFTEIAFILVLALLLFGPKRLPEIGRTVGKGLAEFRRASNDLRRTLESEVAIDDAQEKRRAAGVEPAAPGPIARAEPRAESAPTPAAGEPAAPAEEPSPAEGPSADAAVAPERPAERTD